MEKCKVKEKFNLTDSDLVEIMTAVIADGLNANDTNVLTERKGVSYDKFESLRETLISYSRKGKTESDVRSLRDSVKNKRAFQNYKNVTSYIRSNLSEFEASGLIGDIKGDNFKIN